MTGNLIISVKSVGVNKHGNCKKTQKGMAKRRWELLQKVSVMKCDHTYVSEFVLSCG